MYHFIQQMGVIQFEGIGQAASQGLLVLTCIAFVLRYCSLNAQIQLLNGQVIRTKAGRSSLTF